MKRLSLVTLLVITACAQSPGYVPPFDRSTDVGKAPVVTASGLAFVGPVAVTGAALNQFASTTSAQFFGVISNETGTGNVVASTGATIQTPSIIGTATNDSSCTGCVGEYVEAKQVLAGATGLTTGTPKNVTFMSLTPGDYDVSGVVAYGGSPTGVTFQLCSISSTANTRGATESNEAIFYPNASGVTPVVPCPTIRFSLSATTTVYLVAGAQFSGGTQTAYGTLRARRTR